ncbi:MAG: ATP-binding protein [Agriterribacter sp.]
MFGIDSRNIWLLLTLFLTACKTGRKDDHPEYYERFFKQFDTASRTVYPAALDSLDFAIHHFPAGTGDKARYYRVKAGYYKENRLFDSTFIYLDSLEMTIQGRTEEDRFRNLQWDLLIIRSECYELLKNYEAGLNCLLEAKMLRPTDDKCTAAAITTRTAGMLYRQGRFLLAAQYFRKLIDEAPGCEKPEGLFMLVQGNLNNVGLCYAAVGMPDSAMFYHNAALDYIKAHEASFPQKAAFIKLARGVIYGSIANVKASQHDFEAAETVSLSSIKATEADDPGFTLSTKLNLANLYIEWNKPDKAREILEELGLQYQFNKRGQLEEKRMEWNLAMRKLWGKAGNYLKGYEYGNEYIEIRDSLDMIRKKDISRDIGKEYENKEQQAINERLEMMNQRTSSRLQIALLTIALAVVVVLFVWSSLRRSSRHVKQLTKLNEEINVKNDDLMQAYKSLEESHAENTRMTRMVAHDLKNPIGGIRTLVYSLMEKKQPDDLQKILELVYSTCTSSINTINDLLKDKGSFAAVKQEMVDLRRLMEYCVDLLRTKSDEKQQELHFEGMESVYVKANREKMWRVMSNLISNAIKFSPEHSTIDIMLERRGNHALLAVKDNGIGIPEHSTIKYLPAHRRPPERERAAKNRTGWGSPSLNKLYPNTTAGYGLKAKSTRAAPFMWSCRLRVRGGGRSKNEGTRSKKQKARNNSYRHHGFAG